MERGVFMTTRKISVCYKIITITSLMTGIVLNIADTDNLIALLAYYTMQSNIYALILFIIILYRDLKCKEKTSLYYWCKGQLTIAIFITTLLYIIALVPVGFEMTYTSSIISRSIANIFVHLISPIMVILDYFIFDEKGNFKMIYPLSWLLFPLIYIIFVYLYSYCGGVFYSIGGSRKFAYWFLDYETIGTASVIGWISIIGMAMVGLSYCLVLIDHLRCKNKKS